MRITKSKSRAFLKKKSYNFKLFFLRNTLQKRWYSHNYLLWTQSSTQPQLRFISNLIFA